MAVKVVFVSKSDLTGGAAVVTHRLMDAMSRMGVEASMLVMEKASEDSRVHVVGSRTGRMARFLAERAYIFARNGFSRRDLFKVSIADTGFDLSRHPLVRDADAVVLSWVNQGLMSLNGVRRLVDSGKRVLWVMHDMWCMTGACHHALDCDRYTGECGRCRYFMNGKHEDDLSHRTFRLKQRLYRTCRGLTMVAVSSWLADCARRSTLLGEHDVRILHNAFPSGDFYTRPRGIALPGGIDRSRRLIIMGAARLDDPIKDFPTAIRALNELARLQPDVMESCQAVFYGELRDPSVLDSLRFPYVCTGRINSPEVLHELFACGSVVLSTSLFETLPGTIIEGMAGGCTPVTTCNGGQRDIVDDGTTGYLTTGDPHDIAVALSHALDNPCDREAQHDAIASRFDSQVIAGRMIEMIQSLS